MEDVLFLNKGEKKKELNQAEKKKKGEKYVNMGHSKAGLFRD
jgi:hypothetical protein